MAVYVTSSLISLLSAVTLTTASILALSGVNPAIFGDATSAKLFVAGAQFPLATIWPVTESLLLFLVKSSLATLVGAASLPSA